MNDQSCRGPLIVVEGIDGSGKSSVVRGIVAHLEARGMEVVTSREPTNRTWGQRVRDSQKTERLPLEVEVDYLMRDRREHVEAVILPAQQAGSAVVLDRYYPSMVAYQGARGMGFEALMEANAFAPRPDLLLVLDLPAEVALERIRSRGDVPNSFEQLEALQACRDTFLRFEGPTTVRIDATQGPVAVLACAVQAIERLLVLPPAC